MGLELAELLAYLREKIDIKNSQIDKDILNLYQNQSSRPLYPLIINFSIEWHKYLVNWDELGAEIVDLQNEGIPTPTPVENKAIKITLKPNEVKYLRLNVIGIKNVQQVHARSYCTGTAFLRHISGWTGTHAVNNVKNSWITTASRFDCWNPPILELNGGSEGGTIYITYIALPLYDYSLTYISYPNQNLDGTTSYTYYIALPIRKFIHGVARVGVRCAGDGTNAINVTISVRFKDGSFKQIASISQISSVIALHNIKFPFKLYTEPQNDINFILVEIDVSGYGLLKGITFNVCNYDQICYELNGLKTASASNTLTTVTSYTLLDTNGRANRYKQASVSLSSPAGGTAKLYINGNLVADYSGSSGTFNVPDDIDIWEISVELAGDGTTAATASFTGLEIKGPYLVRR